MGTKYRRSVYHLDDTYEELKLGLDRVLSKGVIYLDDTYEELKPQL